MFVREALNAGGTITPLLIPSQDLVGPSLANPSIYNDKGKLYLNLRNLNYILWHSEKGKHTHKWGPLVYLHREDDVRLVTDNFLCTLKPNLMVDEYQKVDMKLDKPPLWEFVGLEDARIVKWEGKVYLCGVRRDTTTNGQGRMELSEIENGVEISRARIPALNDMSYCEKNWMPILDKPYHFMAWSSPVTVARYDVAKKETFVVHQGKEENVNYRGGSQLVPWKSGYIAVVHETNFWLDETGKKNAVYTHTFLFWDKDWNLIKKSPSFNFMGANIEFACGMCKHENNFLVTFGFQDNAAFLLKVPQSYMESFLNE